MCVRVCMCLCVCVGESRQTQYKGIQRNWGCALPLCPIEDTGNILLSNASESNFREVVVAEDECSGLRSEWKVKRGDQCGELLCTVWLRKEGQREAVL